LTPPTPPPETSPSKKKAPQLTEVATLYVRLWEVEQEGGGAATAARTMAICNSKQMPIDASLITHTTLADVGSMLAVSMSNKTVAVFVLNNKRYELVRILDTSEFESAPPAALVFDPVTPKEQKGAYTLVVACGAHVSALSPYTFVLPYNEERASKNCD